MTRCDELRKDIDLEYTIRKDFRAIKPIRCFARISGSRYLAAGSGFTPLEARRKCDSELLERRFFNETLRFVLKGSKLYGMGAHFRSEKALEHAQHEALEQLFIDEIAEENLFEGISFSFSKKLRVGVSRTSHGWFVLILGEPTGNISQPRKFATQAHRKTLLGAFISAWTEYRNVLTFSPQETALSSWTRSNKSIGLGNLKNLQFRFSFRMNRKPELKLLESKLVKTGDRFIAYFIKRKEEK